MTLRHALLFVALAWANSATAALDLGNASRHTLENGLTVLLLEDRSFPLVSVQMLYRVGARHELPGRTGLAHFVEHLAFRGSENFPDTGLVSSIYAVGGEWHGYTWIDQTTYFATVPRRHLDLLLRIEADRMARLALDPGDIDAEQGAVLAEMQGYENDPAAVLFDATLFAALVAHPYRNNTIGFASDVRAITHDDVTAFYRQHYRPGNAVLAVVGDIDPPAVLTRVRGLFDDIAGTPHTSPPRVVEPPQHGERRVRLVQPAERAHFQIAWRAPGATHPDFPAFLLLQQLLGGSDGVNFLHNEFGTRVESGTLLDGVADDLATWLIPTAEPYVFLVKGSIAAQGAEAELEDAVQAAIGKLRRGTLPDADVAAARSRLLDELKLDLQTTEDAAHQLAYFEGIGALDALLALPARVAALAPADIRRVAETWLSPRQRTIGWLVDGPRVKRDDRPITAVPSAPVTPSPGNREPALAPQELRLSNGIPVILQPSPLSPTVNLQVTLRGAYADSAGRLQRDLPIAGATSFARTVPADALPAAVADAAAALRAAVPAGDAAEPSSNPALRFEQIAARLAGQWQGSASDATPALVVVAGEFDRAQTLERLEDAFVHSASSRPPGDDEARSALHEPSPLSDIEEHIGRPLAQARLGYVVNAPGAADPAADAWRALLYIFSHAYEGRLGKAAISRRGLVYYIDARYRSDGARGLITLSAGVDPAKLDAMRTLLRTELARLASEPPTEAELAEALAHRLGRAQSAAQGNAELTTRLGRDWLWFGAPMTAGALQARLARVTREDLLAIVDDFSAGAVVSVTVDRGAAAN